MTKLASKFLVIVAVLLSTAGALWAQTTTGTISGTVKDEREALVANATVTARNVDTNVARSVQTDDGGRYQFLNLPVGNYEIKVEASGFSKYVQMGITLDVNQQAVVDVGLKAGRLEETVTVTENASVLNTSSPEVGVRFDEKRLSELPISTNRSVYNVALSAAGVSQLGSGQTGFASGISYSANGGRVRSNNFMIDGQDNNDAGVAGAVQPLNNPDLVKEVRLVTNQFAAEYGRNGSSVFNAITRNGTNSLHGSAFWFHNDNQLNACSNTQKAAGSPFCRGTLNPNGREGAPFRIENQFGGSAGGPVRLPGYDGRDKTFFFGTFQRWSDRQLGSGQTINGVPTEAGRAVLRAQAGSRPQVAALLRFLPAAQAPIAGRVARFAVGGTVYDVPLGSLSGATSFALNDYQISGRVDHNISQKHSLTGRYLYNDNDVTGQGQATPIGLSSQSVSRNQSMNLSLTSLLSSKMVNEARASYLRGVGTTAAANAESEQIPSIEVSELGLSGFNAAASRTAIGLAVNLPQFSYRETYQVSDAISYSTGAHSLKFGVDVRRNKLKQFFFPTIRGRLAYSTLERFVNDVADTASINKPLPGGQDVYYYDWHDFYAFGQDEWKVTPTFTLTYGLRYENPGQPITDLVAINNRIVERAGGNSGFRFSPVPTRDKNNFQPRLGFNWNPNTSADGVLGFITGGNKLVFRGGYARTNDYAFTNIASNIASAFPFVAAVDLPVVAQPVSVVTGGTQAVGANNAFTALPAISNSGLNPATLTRTIVGSDFRAPSYDQYSLELQRELAKNLVMRVGYVGTKGSSLFQTVDGNPRRPGCTTVTATDNCRFDQTRATVRLRANSGSSIYHSMQVSLDKRLSKGFSAAFHYTWSAFIDNGSEIFNPSSGEVAIAQDSFNRNADRARSTYDRPHRFTGNAVYELPLYRDQKGLIGQILGGWQINTFFTLQSGAPFTVLNGTDPAGALSGISGLVGVAIRPNLNTSLDLSRMSIEDILRQTGSSTAARALFTATTAAQRVGNSGRNILRADGINNIDFGLGKNFRLGEGRRLQFRADMFNATNTRNFGIPTGAINSNNFLNQWGTDGGNRRIIVGARLVF